MGLVCCFCFFGVEDSGYEFWMSSSSGLVLPSSTSFRAPFKSFMSCLSCVISMVSRGSSMRLAVRVSNSRSSTVKRSSFTHQPQRQVKALKFLCLAPKHNQHSSFTKSSSFTLSLALSLSEPPQSPVFPLR
jgi:hypothetical protein